MGDERQKILIVDDRRENLIALRKVLSDLDVDVVDADNGNDALAATISHRFAVAILDVMMPGMDGYELAELLRGDPKTQRLPIIFLTAYSAEDERVFRGYEAGAVDYIVKPYDPRVLLYKVDVFLELARARAELADKIDALTLSEERFRSLVATIPDIVYRIDEEGRFTFLNQAIQSLGFAQEELIGEHFSRLLLAEDVPKVSRDVVLQEYQGRETGPENAPKLFDERRTGTRITTGLEVRVVRARSAPTIPVEVVSLESSVVVEVNSSGLYAHGQRGRRRVLVGSVGVIRDISERKRTEVEIAEHRDHLSRLVNDKVKEQECIYLISKILNREEWELDRVLDEVVQVIPSGFRHPESSAVRMTVDDLEFAAGGFELDPAAETVTANVIVSGVLRGRLEISFSRLQPEDQPSGGRPEERELLENIARTVGQALERFDAKRALVRSESRFREVWRHAEAGIMLVDPVERRIVDINPVVSELVGSPRDEIIGKVCHGFICPAEEGHCPVLDHDEKVDRSERTLLCADGSNLPVVKSVSPVEVDGREMLLESFLDVSKLKEAEAALRLTQFAIDKAADAVFWMDANARFKYVNDIAAERLGYSRKELLSMTVHDIDPGFPLEAWPMHWEELRDKGALAFESIHRTRDGAEFPVEISASYHSYSGEEYNCAFVRDISDRKKADQARNELQGQLRQAQKMEVVGQLAGGVAHDFNNLLTAILGYAQLLESNLLPDSPDAADLGEIMRAARSASTLTRQLLAFSRKQILAPKVLNINSVVEQSYRMLDRLIGDDVDLRLTREEEIWSTKVDPGQMEQTLVNLAVNAREAMTDGGHLTIETGNIRVQERNCAPCGEGFHGDFVLLSISDTGAGLDAETLGKVFDPFFTTRKERGGTGLGLATVHGIIHQHGGHITVYSEVGVGTCFKVYLPRVDEALSQLEEEEEVTPVGGDETVLVVEDAMAVRTLAERVLTSKGYTVLTADCGAAALEVSNTNQGTIDLLLTDVVMPGMNGSVLSQKIRVNRPGIKVIFMSGYTEDAIAHRGVLDDGVVFLPKPFTSEGLSQMVRRVLDNPLMGASSPHLSAAERLDGTVRQAAIRQARCLDDDIRADLVTAAEGGDAARLRDLVTALMDHELTALAETTEVLLEEYAYEDLLEVFTEGG